MALGLKFCKVIVIDNKLVTDIIGRINVNHLDPTEVGLAENFEDIEIIAIDVEIFGCIEVNRFFAARAQSEIDRLVSETGCCTLIRPRELVAFLSVIERFVRQFRTELVEVNGKFRLTIFI